MAALSGNTHPPPRNYLCMALEEYKRKRDFKHTPEPGPVVEKKNAHRYVIQKHHASHLHYDFRLEMDGVLVSWAVPKGPPMDPAQKRLAMQVEDHPVSYFHFEGAIPPGNYGAGTVMVWDTGTWAPMAAEPGKQPDVKAMMKKGDFKFRLSGRKLKGDFGLINLKKRRPGSKGNEWLLIKKKDEHVIEGFDAGDEAHDWSVLTNRSLGEIAGDEGSATWQSNRAAAPAKKGKQDWLADSIATADAKKKKSPPVKKPAAVKRSARKAGSATAAKTAAKQAPTKSGNKKKAFSPEQGAPGELAAVGARELASVKNAERGPMPRVIKPMLATLVDEPFNNKDWLFEVKFDGYRAVAYIENRKARLFSRNQNEFTDEFPELRQLSANIECKSAVLDGEICALDDQGRPSFSLMQQRTGFEPDLGIRRGGRGAQRNQVPIVFYLFDVLYLDGYSLMRVDLEVRKEILQKILETDDVFRYSEHFLEKGVSLFHVAKEKALEGIIAKRRKGCYLQKRTREWLKMKVVQRQECVIGGFTEPRGSRENFGSLVLGLYDAKGNLIPVGQAGSGFTHKSHAEMWQKLKKLETTSSPFANKPDSSRGLHYVRPQLVAEIKFTEWTHEANQGRRGAVSGLKMRAPVFQGLRADKSPKECRFEVKKSARTEAQRAERGDAA